MEMEEAEEAEMEAQELSVVAEVERVQQAQEQEVLEEVLYMVAEVEGEQVYWERELLVAHQMSMVVLAEQVVQEMPVLVKMELHQVVAGVARVAIQVAQLEAAEEPEEK